jgi:hypothetical protein
VEALSREVVTAAQATGATASLWQRVFRGTTAFVSRTIGPDRAGVAAPAGRATVARAEALLREPLLANLYEVLLPVARPTAGARYGLFVRAYPALGKSADLFALTAAEAKAQQEQGFDLVVSRPVVSPDGTFLVAAYPLADLEALERMTRELAATPR